MIVQEELVDRYSFVHFSLLLIWFYSLLTQSICLVNFVECTRVEDTDV